VIADSPLVSDFWQHGPAADCRVIDLHGHMGPWPAIYMPRNEPEAMLRSMDQAGVERLVFSSHEALFSPLTGNDYTAEVVRRHGDRFSGLMVINGNYMDVVERDLKRFDAMRDAFIGFKFLAAYHQVALDDPRYDRVWAFAHERKLMVTCHTWGNDSRFNGADNVRRVVERFDEVRLTMAHSLYGQWDAAAALATEFPHVYCDLTAVFEVRGALERLVERGCTKRMVFGTDLPWFSPLQGVGAVLSAEISDADRLNILHRNADELLAPLLAEQGV